MKRNILKEMLSDAYDAWFNDRLTGSEYHHFAELVTDKADELLDAHVITDDQWSEVNDENWSNWVCF